MKVLRSLMLFGLMSLAATAFAASHMEAKSEAKPKVAGKVDMTAILEAKERQVQEAYKNKDAKTFMTMVDETGWFADPSGIISVSAAPEMMKDVELKSYTLENFKTYMIDPNVYVATYTWNGDATYKGQPYPGGPWYVSTVWAKRGKEWKAVYHQETLSMQGMSPPTASH